jgi:hypothetical protein
MDSYRKYWLADPTERWRLLAVPTEEGWNAVVYDREERMEVYREFAVDEEDAKAKARRFIIGMVPPLTFHKGRQIAVNWQPQRGDVLSSI